MDNLISHHNQQMSAIIIAGGHHIVFRAPYYSVDGPIEYVFNTIQGVLRKEIDHAIVFIPSFAPYFINCGFWLSD